MAVFVSGSKFGSREPQPSAKHLGTSRLTESMSFLPNYKRSITGRCLLFPAVTQFCKVVVFASSLIFLMLISCALLSFCPALLTIALQGLWIQSQGVGGNRCHSAQSSTSVAFFCMRVPFFLLAAVWKFLSSAQDLYQYPPTHSHFTGFRKSSQFPACTANKSIFLDSLMAVLISTPCSICCWVMQRGRRAAIICPEAQRGCACALALMSCVRGFCSLSTKVLPELQPLV